MSLQDFKDIKTVLKKLDNNRPIHFGFTEQAIEDDIVEGTYVEGVPLSVEEHKNSIPDADQSAINEFNRNFGLRTNASSLLRMGVNHIFGRLSYNLIQTIRKVNNLVDDHLVNVYFAPSGKVVEDITVGQTEDVVNLIQHKANVKFDASAITSSAAVSILSALPASEGFDGRAGVMTPEHLSDIAEMQNDINANASDISTINTVTIPAINTTTTGLRTDVDKNTSDISKYIKGAVAYNRDDFFKAKSATARTTIVTPAYVEARIDDSDFYLTVKEEIDLDTTDKWDDVQYKTPANRAGLDFYIYACIPDEGNIFDIVLSRNSTTPSGYSVDESRKIGGFHCLCVSAGDTGANGLYSYINEGKDADYQEWIYADGSTVAVGDTRHWLHGYIAGDILPFSCWDLLHRPNEHSDVEGKVYNPKTNKWIGIYLPSWNAGLQKVLSVNGGAISSGDTTPKFHFYRWEQVFANQGESMLKEKDFVSASLGCPQGVNIYGSANPVTTGGHKATNNLRILSNIGCEDMVGVFSQWVDERGSNLSSTEANAYDANDKNVGGQHYSNTSVANFGRAWIYGVECGSRGSVWNNSPLALHAAASSRAASEPKK